MPEVRCPSCGSELERFDRAESFSFSSREEENAGRVFVRITSYRRRLIDSSNLCGKWFTDCLRYGGFLRDDTPEEIVEEIRQVKVLLATDERTEIELIFPEDFKSLVNKNRFT